MSLSETDDPIEMIRQSGADPEGIDVRSPARFRTSARKTCSDLFGS
jgi:hypothetical protein